MAGISERYAGKIDGVLGCFDRMIISGTLPALCCADGMTSCWSARGMRIFDFVKLVQPLTEAIKANAEALAAQAGLKIGYIRKKNFRKQDRVKAVIEQRGGHPGLVGVFSALEPCTTYQPWHDKPSGRAFLRHKDGKCLHYYFYFIAEELGPCYVRVPSWCPFRPRFCSNGHNWLARQLQREGSGYRLLDNAFVEIENWQRAQPIADSFKPAQLHRRLEEFVPSCCPIFPAIESQHHWSLDTAAYASDGVFRRQADLRPLYGEWIRTAIHTVKPDDIATFLGKKLTANYSDEMGNRYNLRIEGTRVRHAMGKSSIKMCDKFGRIPRIETTTLGVTFFRHCREAEQRDGARVMKYAPMKKTICSLAALREVLEAAHRRYLEFLPAIGDPSRGRRKLRRLTRTVHRNARGHRGFNLFDGCDERLFEVLARGEFQIRGMGDKALRAQLSGLTSGQASRLLKRLRTHGIIKKVSPGCRYYLTALGRQVIALGLRLKNLAIMPQLAIAEAG